MPKACDDLVENEERAVLAAKLSASFEEAALREHHAGVMENWLDDDCG